RTVLGTFLFVLGFSVVFTSYGAAFGGIGFLLLGYQRALTVVLGVVTIVLGLGFCGLLQRIPWTSRTARITYRPPSGLAGAAMLGVLFGIGWTPCMGPTLSAVLSLSVSSGGAIRGALLAFVYSLGLGVPFLLAAVAAEQAMRWFSWPRRHARLVMTVGGGFLVAIGVLQVTGVWSALVTEMQVAVSGWQVPL
ncbi:MAG: cytochrome c biogenesis protein CcdA, partial [Candidatus Nanopelagicales bacterium]